MRWASLPKAEDTAQKLALLLKCPTQPSSALIDCLRFYPHHTHGHHYQQRPSSKIKNQVKKRGAGDGSPRRALFLAPRWGNILQRSAALKGKEKKVSSTKRIFTNHIPSSHILFFHAQARLSANRWTSGRQGEQMEETSIDLSIQKLVILINIKLCMVSCDCACFSYALNQSVPNFLILYVIHPSIHLTQVGPWGWPWCISASLCWRSYAGRASWSKGLHYSNCKPM